MYLRSEIKLKNIFFDSWRFLLIAVIWSSVVLYLHDVRGYKFIAIPITPITVFGIAVSLYLGFKSSSAYQRWWEARKIWGEIVNDSRSFANQTHNLIDIKSKVSHQNIKKDLIYRHLSWLNALCYQLRKVSCLKESDYTHIFNYRRIFSDNSFHNNKESYEKYLSDEEKRDVNKYRNPAVHIIKNQGQKLRNLFNEGLIDSYRFIAMMTMLNKLYDCQGKCERIKNTPFPQQIEFFGIIFTWIFIFLVPLALVDVFDKEAVFYSFNDLLTHHYMFVMVPFAVLISWTFFMIEKITDSTDDPFEGGPTDVPISTLCRNIEIDLKQFLDETSIPQPLEPVDGVLY